MCGICAYIGYQPGIEQALHGINLLLNRGYDSVGISGLQDNKFILEKYASTNEKEAIELITPTKDKFSKCEIISCHSRWCTTGAKTDNNAHPHIDYTNRFSIVHNGIIENYEEIKQELISKYNVTFKSETDTEVIVNLISVMYDECKKHTEEIKKQKPDIFIEEAMNLAFQRLEGTWAVVLISTLEPDKLYCARHGSPLLVGFGTNFMMVASEQSGFRKYINNYICLNDKDVITLERKDGKVLFTKQENYPLREVVPDLSSPSPDPYNHWTMKEINEQYDASLRAMGMGGRLLNNKEVKLGGLAKHEPELKAIENLILLGCGTSYYSALYCAPIFKKLCGFNTVQLFDGAAFTKYDIPNIGKTAAIFISQSGETKDLHKCIEICKDMDIFMIGVINVVDSLIAREVNCGVYLNAGREEAVASTKAFTSQSVVLSEIAVWFAQIRKLNEFKREKIMDCLRRLPIDIKSTIDSVHENCKAVAQYLVKQNSAFLLGTDQCEAIAKEGSLKIKEIGYVHAEGYSTGALKHGPYSLIVPGTPVIVITIDNENYKQNNSVIEEIKSREGYVVKITDKQDKCKSDIVIKIPKNEIFNSLLAVIPLQLIAYEVAILKGHNPDRPKNLCKTVSTH